MSFEKVRTFSIEKVRTFLVLPAVQKKKVASIFEM